MSSSNLQRLTSEKLSIFFGGYTIRENLRPEWMPTENGGRLELDFYIEELNCAIEVQGVQHYEYSEFFHGEYDNFRAQQERDRIKRDRCAARGIKLYEIFDEQGLYEAIENIQDMHNLARLQDELLQYAKAQQNARKPQRQIEKKKPLEKGATARERGAREIAKYVKKWMSTKRPKRKAERANKLKKRIDKYLEQFEMSDFNCAGIYEAEIIKDFYTGYEYQDPAQFSHEITDLTPTNYNRAKYKLSIKQLSKNRFRVTGGNDPHIVFVDEYGNVQCDCSGFAGGLHGKCSHIWKYYQEFGQDKVEQPRTLRLI